MNPFIERVFMKKFIKTGSWVLLAVSFIGMDSASALALGYSNYECHSMARLGPVKKVQITIEEGVFVNDIVQVTYEGKNYPVQSCIVDQRPQQISFRCVPGTRVPLIFVDCYEL